MNEPILKTEEIRKLASVQVIKSISPIPNADAIEVAEVLGWKVVVKKGEFNVGDHCVYFECDSILPFESWSEFLRDKNRPDKPIRLKTIKLRGQISQGLVVSFCSLNIAPYYHDGTGILKETYKVGDDLTSLLKIEKYEPTIHASLIGVQKGDFPSFIPKTDELRVQSYPDVLEELKDKEVIITLKLDGLSFTAYVKDGVFGVCSRNMELVEDPDNLYWKMALDLDLREKMLATGRNLAIQAELCGPKVQDNKMGLKALKLFEFNIYDIDAGHYLSDIELPYFANLFGVYIVPVVYRGIFKWMTVDELLAFADALNYENHSDTHDSPAEGIVIRPALPFISQVLRKRMSVKVISNRFLLKYPRG